MFVCSSRSEYVLIAGAYVLPHPEKMAKGGEDWFFVSDTLKACGVADGVGGWVSDVRTPQLRRQQNIFKTPSLVCRPSHRVTSQTIHVILTSCKMLDTSGLFDTKLERSRPCRIWQQYERLDHCIVSDLPCRVCVCLQAEVGVDAGAYARQLMGHAKDQADKATHSDSEDYQSACSSISTTPATSSSGSSSNSSTTGSPVIGSGAGPGPGSVKLQDLSGKSSTVQLQQQILEKAYYKTEVRGAW